MFGMRKKSGDPELDAAVRELAEADTVAFGGVGFAGTLLPVTEAYRRVAEALVQRPRQAREQVDWLLRHGSPAGRAYAATLLEGVGRAAGRDAWAALRDDDGEFTTFDGCLMGTTTLGGYAADRLAARPPDRDAE
ncbi:hypothetical protein [Micromonospora sp. WMMD714]|uniref:hypothetical protein n=1 Tax=Micromonospora sp. WMMD714 TaxID=3016097 RepID=UPI00249B7948|nr:hypothetical protein [Micromonospora sp. WMMD714]WFE63258.1 hypothetical protein O7625_08140 [Micromonospora sp. WMMD714]